MSPDREVRAHAVNIEFLVVELHQILVYAHVYRFSVSEYVSPANGGS